MGICDFPLCIKETFEAADGTIRQGRELSDSRIRAHKANAKIHRLAQVAEAQQDAVDELGDQEFIDEEPEELSDDEQGNVGPGPEESAILLGTVSMPADPATHRDSVAVRPRDIADDDYDDDNRSHSNSGGWVTRLRIARVNLLPK